MSEHFMRNCSTDELVRPGITLQFYRERIGEYSLDYMQTFVLYEILEVNKITR